MYQKELRSLHRSNRFRERTLFEKKYIDLASNDYLGLSTKKSLIEKTYTHLLSYDSHAAKASLLVNGYHPSHQLLEEYLCEKTGFEKGIIVGSGFLANLSLFEALPRKGDLLLVDEEYHASGILGTKVSQGDILFFSHNNLEDLKKKWELNAHRKRIFIATEGIFSMGGDAVPKAIIEFAVDAPQTYLILDEAHSVGVKGKNLLGILDHYAIQSNKIIKMGTLGKALGSYGAYILASEEIISFLENRAKGIIYTTALSPFDTLLAYYGFLSIEENLPSLKNAIEKRQKMLHIEGLIYIIKTNNIETLIKHKEHLLQEGYLVGAIRPPTVKTPLLRISAKLDVPLEALRKIRELV